MGIPIIGRIAKPKTIEEGPGLEKYRDCVESTVPGAGKNARALPKSAFLMVVLVLLRYTGMKPTA